MTTAHSSRAAADPVGSLSEQYSAGLAAARVRSRPALRWQSKAIALGTCALVALPVLGDLVRSPRYRPFGYAAGDTFYYLGVARSIVEHGSVSSDWVHATNGFHPLWQLVTALVYGLCKLMHSETSALLALILTSLACAVAAVWFFARAFLHATRSVPIAFLTLPIGVYALVASYYWRIGPAGANGGAEGPLPVYGTLYSFVNGMESSLALLAFALMMWTFVRRQGATSARAGLACGACCAFLSLSRLDHAAFVLTPVVLWCVELFQPRARRHFLLAALAAAILPIVAYCGINQWYAGTPIPISGSQKSTFPMPYLGQLGSLLEIWRAPFAAHDPLMVYRIFPILFCSLSAIGYVLVVTRWRVGATGVFCSMRPFTTSLDAFLVKMAPGVLLLSAYDLLFVYGIGHWYFPVATLYCSLSFISLWQTAWRRVNARFWLSAMSASGIAMLIVVGFCRFHYKPDYHLRYANFFWQTAPLVKKALSPVPAIVEVDDGLVSYALGVPSMSGMGYLLDVEAARSQHAGRLFEVAYHRGIRAVSTLYYAEHELRANSSPKSARAWAAQLLGNEDLSAYDARVLYGDANFTIVGLSRSDR